MPGRFSHHPLAAALLAVTACAGPLALGDLTKADSPCAAEQAAGLRPLVNPTAVHQLSPAPGQNADVNARPMQVNLFADLATAEPVKAPVRTQGSLTGMSTPRQVSTDGTVPRSASYHVRTAEVDQRDHGTIFAPPVENIGLVRKNPLIANEVPQLKRLDVRKFPVRRQPVAASNATATETIASQPQALNHTIADAVAPLPPLPTFTDAVASVKQRPANIQFGSIKNAKTLRPVRPISVPVGSQPAYRTATVDLNRVSQSDQSPLARAPQRPTAKTVSQRLPAKPQPDRSASLAALLRAAAPDEATETVQGLRSSGTAAVPHVTRKAVTLRLSDDATPSSDVDDIDLKEPSTRLQETPPPATRIMSSSACHRTGACRNACCGNAIRRCRRRRLAVMT